MDRIGEPAYKTLSSAVYLKAGSTGDGEDTWSQNKTPDWSQVTMGQSRIKSLQKWRVDVVSSC